LACCAASASVKRCFSASADTCGHNQGRLSACTIERCVSSHKWLVQGIKPDGQWEKAQKTIAQATLDDKKIKAYTRKVVLFFIPFCLF
jgi:hypothetical protein